MISALLPIALAAAVEPGWSMALWTAALYIVVEGITGQLIEPLLYGHSTGISPFAVVVAAIFWSWVWGPVGLFLSTPLTLCLVVIGRNVKRLEFLDVMFGDQPALSPVETFYQRLLADDADEVVEQAETLLKDMTLASYYDEVALPGMQLVAADADRGVLEPEQLDTVKTAIYELVETLAEHVEPAGDGRAEGVLVAPAGLEAPAILSIAGRGRSMNRLRRCWCICCSNRELRGVWSGTTMFHGMPCSIWTSATWRWRRSRISISAAVRRICAI
jgi:Predicted permease